MEFSSQQELYNKLLPVFDVKKRLIKNSRYKNITNEDIWHHLIETKWKSYYNLTLSDIVNDIITLDLELITKRNDNIWKKLNLQ